MATQPLASAVNGSSGFKWVKKGNMEIFSPNTFHAQSVKAKPLAVMAFNGIGGLWIAALPLREIQNLYFNQSQLGRKGRKQL